MSAEQPAAGRTPTQMLEEQVNLLSQLESTQQATLKNLNGQADTQTEMVRQLFNYMRVTMDVQEAMIKQLYVISVSSVVIAAAGVIGVIVLLTQ
jgi:outer membrane PBP1 activator LpoA protein